MLLRPEEQDLVLATPLTRTAIVLAAEVISISKTTPSSITVLVDNKTVTISGESFVRGHGSPDFIIDIASIKSWDKPFDTVAITGSERAFVVDYLLKELTARQWCVIAE